MWHGRAPLSSAPALRQAGITHDLSDYPWSAHPLGPDHQRQGQHIHAGCTRRLQGPGAGIQGGARGAHIVDQQDAPALNGRAPPGGHAEGACHIAGSRRPAGFLRRRALSSDQNIRAERPARLAGCPLRQQGRLVVAPGPEPRPMQRHRGHQIGLGQQFLAGARQPAAEKRRQIGAIGMFEGQQHRPAAGIVAQHGAGPVIDRRTGMAGRAQSLIAHLEFEGIGTTRTAGRRQEFDCPPAGRAQRAGFGRSRPTAGTTRRQDEIEQPRWDPPQ